MNDRKAWDNEFRIGGTLLIIFLIIGLASGFPLGYIVRKPEVITKTINSNCIVEKEIIKNIPEICRNMYADVDCGDCLGDWNNGYKTGYNKGMIEHNPRGLLE